MYQLIIILLYKKICINVLIAYINIIKLNNYCY